MKKFFAWLLCLLIGMTALPAAVFAEEAPADELDSLVTMTAPKLSEDKRTVTAELQLVENHGLTGLQVAISYNRNLLSTPTVMLDGGFFGELIASENGDCPIYTFLDGKKKEEGGTFATVSFNTLVELTPADLLIYLLPRDKMTGDYTIYPPDPGPGPDPDPGDNSGGGGGSGGSSASGSSAGGSSAGGGTAKPDSKPVTAYPDNAGTGLWVEHEDGSWSFEKGEEPVDGWQQIDKNWFFFDRETAKMQVSWVKDDGKWYYLAESGVMKTGWVKDDGRWYLLAKNGVMKTGWARDEGKWYFLAKDGAMKTGWIKDDGKWYFLAKDGFMYTGWVLYEGKWYYLSAAGAMLTDTVTPDGHRVDENGVWIS